MTVSREALAVLGEIRKNYGPDAGHLGSEIIEVVLPRCTSGSVALDAALGGGWPMNQWCEIVGNESSGKSVLAAKTIAANQAVNPDWTAVWIDGEGSYERAWFQRLGVNVDQLIVLTINGMEEVYNAAIRYFDSRAVDCLVIDSLPALTPESEGDGAMEDFQVGLGARLTGKFFRKQRSAIKRSMVEDERPVLALMINQWREKVGVIFGDPRTTPGGRGKNYAYVIRVEVKRDEWITENKIKFGQVMKFVCFKNKSGVPQREATVDFYFDDLGEFRAGQFDEAKDILNVAVSRGVIDVGSSGMYVYGDRRWRGRPTMTRAVREDPELREALKTEVIAKSRPKKVAAVKKATAKKATVAKKAAISTTAKKLPAKKAVAAKKVVR